MYDEKFNILFEVKALLSVIVECRIGKRTKMGRKIISCFPDIRKLPDGEGEFKLYDFKSVIQDFMYWWGYPSWQTVDNRYRDFCSALKGYWERETEK